MRTYTVTDTGPGFVYVIKDESERRKLGLAQDVESRLRQLQTGNAERLTIEYRLAVANMKKAESALHSIFSASRIRQDGEWFKLTGPQLILLYKIFRAYTTTHIEEQRLTTLGFR